MRCGEAREHGRRFCFAKHYSAAAFSEGVIKCESSARAQAKGLKQASPGQATQERSANFGNERQKSKSLRVGKVVARFALKEGEDLTLRVFIDKTFVEVFANDRQAAATAIPFVAENTGINLFSKGGAIEVKTLKTWKMKSTYAEK
ncbi:MAG: hypothetical protein DVB27_13785 [Verrucomicrobia bacterium]|nr:MAG: hypothetical protein DVB27_13785 [Verrucomicrobiota bacterium]